MSLNDNGRLESSTEDELPPATPEELSACEALIEAWLARQVDDNEVVASVERDFGGAERRWVVRLEGEEKSFSAVWFHLRQRTLHVETYFMPSPEENHAQLYEYLLRRASRFNGFSFVIGLEDAVYLVGNVPVQWVSQAELDRLLGSIFVYVEQCFRPAMRIGYATRFKG